MNKSDKANSFLDGLLDGEPDLQAEIEAAAATPPDPETQFIVYFIGDKPDTVWEYNHKPEGGKITDINGNETGEFTPYGRVYGYWTEDKEAKEARHFVENKSTNLKLMDFETFLERVPPNKDQVKIYDSETEFLLELI
jgi:hypothetical protein